MNAKDVLQHYEFPHNQFKQDNMAAKIAAQVADMTDRAIVTAIAQAAAENGITDLYLMDKQFIQEALEEKLARMNNEPLTIEELREMDGEPVWAEHWHGGEWIIVHWNFVRDIASTCKACLHEHEYGETWRAYRHKPKEV